MDGYCADARSLTLCNVGEQQDGQTVSAPRLTAIGSTKTCSCNVRFSSACGGLTLGHAVNSPFNRQTVCVNLTSNRFIQPESAQSAPQSPKSCDSVKEGYTCQTDISRLWGQYSPYYEVESEIPPGVPPQCTITFAQILSRHGARFPNPKKTKRYGKTIEKIQKNVRSFKGKYAFLQKYKYDLGADDLTPFGVQEMVNSGTDFFNRYEDLVKKLDKGPFVRASDQQRVVDSATNFTAGFHTAKVAAAVTDKAYPYDTVLINEQPGSNNTQVSFPAALVRSVA